MQMQKLIENVNWQIPQEQIRYNEPMKNHTSFKVGGPADVYIKVQKESELIAVQKFAKQYQIPMAIIGNGSNILVADKGIRGIVVQIDIKKLQIEELENGKRLVTIGAGNKIAEVAHALAKQEISGFEELAGIPGTIGGAVKMNAGAYGKEVKDIIKQAKIINASGEKSMITKEEMQFRYRNSIFSTKKAIILEAEFILSLGEKEKISKKMQEYMNLRKEKQPIEYPSAGSTFKRGASFITAQLIDQAGLKGYQIGGAQISEKHAGFVVNKQNATAKDIRELIEYAKKVVYEKTGEIIELEVELMGEFEI